MSSLLCCLSHPPGNFSSPIPPEKLHLGLLLDLHCVLMNPRSRNTANFHLDWGGFCGQLWANVAPTSPIAVSHPSDHLKSKLNQVYGYEYQVPSPFQFTIGPHYIVGLFHLFACGDLNWASRAFGEPRAFATTTGFYKQFFGLWNYHLMEWCSSRKK